MLLPESTGGDGRCREMQELGSWRSVGWALPPQCQLHLLLQKSCVRVGSDQRVLVRGQQLSRTSREPQFSPGFFLFLSDLQYMSVKHLKHL